MSSPEELHADAVVARVKAFFPDTFDVDDVPETPSYPIIVVSVDQGGPATKRATASTGWTRWRAVVNYHGKTAASCRVACSRQKTALDMHRLLVAGFTTRLCSIESSIPVGKEQDDDRTEDAEQLFVGTTVWVFGSQPQSI